MKKLLHERLRESQGWGDLFNPIEVFNASFRVLFDKLADEIERYYIPRPRFEDGEPVHFGDALERRVGLPTSVVGIAVHNDGSYALSDNEENTTYYTDGDLIKRPYPKVMDADGVVINEGETVWSEYGDEYFVDTIENADCIYLLGSFDDEVHVRMSPCCLTHKNLDSLEKLRDDMAGWNELKRKTFCSEWIDRLTALIEMEG